MQLIADFHIHSHYSRATSKRMNIEELYKWGKIKGINIIGSGDFTHPAWFEELQEKLEPAEPGLFKLKKKYAAQQDKLLNNNIKNKLIRFILTSEISNIYSKNNQVRKLHNLIVAPDFKTVSKINFALDKIGNLKADGRPILGLDSKELLKISLESNPDNLFIPAHIWTPWFSMFGSKSGFDSIGEAFEDLSKYIYAIETGLSSDPIMNWRIKDLDNLTLLSNSDAHSPEKLGREANILDCKLDYFEIIKSIKNNNKKFLGTIEFFPQEGKYHYDGHRKCGVCFNPTKSKQHNLICPKCGQKLVLGVDFRVDQLASRKPGFKPKNAKKHFYIIPLLELICEIENIKNINSKKIQNIYFDLINTLGPEFKILKDIKTNKIQEAGFPILAQAIKNMRQNKILIKPGFDGVFGIIKAFKNKDEMKKASGQISLL